MRASDCRKYKNEWNRRSRGRVGSWNQFDLMDTTQQLLQVLHLFRLLASSEEEKMLNQQEGIVSCLNVQLIALSIVLSHLLRSTLIHGWHAKLSIQAIGRWITYKEKTAKQLKQNLTLIGLLITFIPAYKFDFSPATLILTTRQKREAD